MHALTPERLTQLLAGVPVVFVRDAHGHSGGADHLETQFASRHTGQGRPASLWLPHSKSRLQVGEFDSALPDDAGSGLAKRVRRPTRFYGESSSDSETNSGSSDGSDSSGASFSQQTQPDIDRCCTG